MVSKHIRVQRRSNFAISKQSLSSLCPLPLSLSLMLISCKFEKQENEFEFNATVPKMNLPRISWHKLLKRNYPRDSVFKYKKQENKENEKHGNPANAVNALQLNSSLKNWRLLGK